MTAPDLCRLASAAFPLRSFTGIALERHGRLLATVAQSSELSVHHNEETDLYSVTVRGSRQDYQSGQFATIEEAHADALACRAEHEPAPTVSAPAQLPLL
jgi:hypothetical protein